MSNDIEKPIHFMREYADAYAKAKADRVYLQHFRKTKKALLMIEKENCGKKTTVSERENYAYAHLDYKELLEGLRVATEVEEKLALDFRAAELAVEIWRTKQANERAERHGYGA